MTSWLSASAEGLGGHVDGHESAVILVVSATTDINHLIDHHKERVETWPCFNENL